MKQFAQRFHNMEKFTIQLRNLNTVIILLLLRNIKDFSQLNIDVNSNIPAKNNWIISTQCDKWWRGSYAFVFVLCQTGLYPLLFVLKLPKNLGTGTVYFFVPMVPPDKRTRESCGQEWQWRYFLFLSRRLHGEEFHFRFSLRSSWSYTFHLGKKRFITACRLVRSCHAQICYNYIIVCSRTLTPFRPMKEKCCIKYNESVISTNSELSFI